MEEKKENPSKIIKTFIVFFPFLLQGFFGCAWEERISFFSFIFSFFYFRFFRLAPTLSQLGLEVSFEETFLFFPLPPPLPFFISLTPFESFHSWSLILLVCRVLERKNTAKSFRPSTQKDSPDQKSGVKSELRDRGCENWEWKKKKVKWIGNYWQ